MAKHRREDVVDEPDTTPIPVVHPRSKKRNALLALACGLITFLLVLGAVSWGWKEYTGSWPSFSLGESALVSDPSISAPLPVSPQPAAAPVPAAQPESIELGEPSKVMVRRGQRAIVTADTVGTYVATGNSVDPPGNEPVWLTNVGTKIGTGMGTAWIAGHSELGNAATPFTQLGLVQRGDVIDIAVASGKMVSFVVDSVEKPLKGAVTITNDPGVIKLVSCTLNGQANVIVTGHATSL